VIPNEHAPVTAPESKEASEVYYESTVLRIGEEAPGLTDGGVLILYADPIPEALESVSVVHQPSRPLTSEIRPGDTFSLGDQHVELVAVGDRATENLRTLGHVVLYLNGAAGQLLPGALHGRGTLSVPAAGARLALGHGPDRG
jgi:PTS system glucitol/sorbitol-specific IIA component